MTSVIEGLSYWLNRSIFLMISANLFGLFSSKCNGYCIFSNWSFLFFLLKGNFPSKTSYIIIPRAQTSTLKLNYFYSKTYGAMYSKVPQT